MIGRRQTSGAAGFQRGDAQALPQQELAKAGDLKGLRKFEINRVSSSPKAIARYRDLCIIALEAQAAR